MASKADVTDALRAIIDPDLHQDIVSLGFLKEVEIEDGHVMAQIHITTPACPVRDEFKTQAERLIGDLPGVKSVTVRITAPEQRRTSPVKESGLEEVTSIIAVASCKGGVGKSTVGRRHRLRAGAARSSGRPAGTPTSSARRCPRCSTGTISRLPPDAATCWRR